MITGILIRNSSIEAFSRNLLAVRGKIVETAVDVLEEVASSIMDVSLSMVPKDTHTLANSNYYSEAVEEDDVITAHLGYASSLTDLMNPKTGKMASQYAEEAHESLFHITGEGKFLEVPVMLATEEFFDKLEKALAAALA